MNSLPQLSSRSVFLALFAVSLLTLIAYFPSLSVPFYLDDRDSIVTNNMVHAPSLDLLWQSWMRSRIVGYATFWANYHSNGLEPFGFHLVNIVIHLLNCGLVFIFSYMLLQRLNIHGRSENGGHNKLWAILVTAIWALHPLNSQVVIYIVQRLAAIVALFYLLTIVFYIKAREAQSLNSALGYGFLVFVCFVLGFHSKQNYATVVVFLYCWELYTANQVIRRWLVNLTGFGLVGLLLIAPFITEFWQALDKFTRDYNAGTRVDYFYSQMVIIWDYLLRFFYPVNLQLDIEVAIKSQLDSIVALAMLGHIAVLTLVFRLRSKIPLLFVGVLFYYSSHLVESFIIPIKDYAFEHRTYIGNIGLVLGLVGVIEFYWRKAQKPLSGKTLLGTATVLSLLFTVMVFQRAMLWQQPEAFYANEVKLSPGHARANASYGNELMIREKYAQAEPYLKKSVDINMSKNQITASGLIAYMTVLYQQDKFQEGSRVAMTGLKYIQRPWERSLLLSNLAVGYIYMGYCDFAVGLLNTAIELDPNNNDAKSNMAYCRKKLSGS